MKYRVDNWVFDKNPNVLFGIIIGKGLINSVTTDADSMMLQQSEEAIHSKIDFKMLKAYPQVAIYREALRKVEINPNKFMNSVEAMSKRVLKNGFLPRINAMVDLCNAVALKEVISLGAHDLKDIDADLSVRLSRVGDVFRPFGSTEFEDVPAGELVFTSGSKVQTRQWLWRQSELGKITEGSSDIIFQLVGFKGDYYKHFTRAMKAVEEMIKYRFDGESKSYVVNSESNEIEFEV